MENKEDAENSVTYEDVHIDFIEDEWILLNPSQKSLYKVVILETYRNLTALGYSWKDHNFEEHCQNARKHGR
ncbi:zinc finger protein 431-like [Microtus pennsylvanicus]|uniref:zinc finger protein 431-like n=1 Tax=Microtus pennsylvanicus TaxID=10058 RepID=UPI003F6CC96F